MGEFSIRVASQEAIFYRDLIGTRRPEGKERQRRRYESERDYQRQFFLHFAPQGAYVPGCAGHLAKHQRAAQALTRNRPQLHRESLTH